MMHAYYRLYLKAIGSYIMDVTTFLDTLHNKYSEWIMKSTTTAICAKSSERTLTGAISEVTARILSMRIISYSFFQSLDLVGCIFNICTNKCHALEREVIEAQCHKWFMVFIKMVNFADDMGKVHLDMFLSKAKDLQMEGVLKALIEYVSQTTPCLQVERWLGCHSRTGSRKFYLVGLM